MTKRLSKWKKGAILFALFFVFAGVYVAWKIWQEDDCACGLSERTPFALLNPFRERASQQIAERYIRSVQNGTCSQLPSTIFIGEDAKRTTCALHYPVNVWELRALSHRKDSVTYAYGVGYAGDPVPGNPLWLTLQNTNGTWRIEHADTFY